MYLVELYRVLVEVEWVFTEESLRDDVRVIELDEAVELDLVDVFLRRVGVSLVVERDRGRVELEGEVEREDGVFLLELVELHRGDRFFSRRDFSGKNAGANEKKINYIILIKQLIQQCSV